MTKKEKHQLINRDFLTFVEEEMDDRYIIEDNGDGGRVHLILEDGEGHGYGDNNIIINLRCTIIISTNIMT